ncbi:hypothetical protein [Lentzea kentuckyensis]|uniref:hypothetical protein n=1 Tax=Lentzea kentuckyensis TaxID=360086 RepID=UPI000A370317|nr:hypothetical protein [Lentzea kentuckyensis]
MTLPMQIDFNEETGISAMTVDIPVDASAAFAWDAVDDIYAVHKRLVYQTTEGTPLTHHLGTMVVREDDTGVHLVWTTEFAPASQHDWATSLMNEFAELMKKTLDAAYASQL